MAAGEDSGKNIAKWLIKVIELGCNGLEIEYWGGLRRNHGNEGQLRIWDWANQVQESKSCRSSRGTLVAA
jgi:hypothetical protein